MINPLRINRLVNRWRLTPVRDQQARVMEDLLALCRLHEEAIRATPLVDEANYDNLIFLLEKGLERNHEVPVDKTGRWIGFVQCALIVRQLLDTKAERDATRAGFHAAYEATGQLIPKTLDR